MLFVTVSQIGPREVFVGPFHCAKLCPCLAFLHCQDSLVLSSLASAWSDMLGPGHSSPCLARVAAGSAVPVHYLHSCYGIFLTMAGPVQHAGARTLISMPGLGSSWVSNISTLPSCYGILFTMAGPDQLPKVRALISMPGLGGSWVCSTSALPGWCGSLFTINGPAQHAMVSSGWSIWAVSWVWLVFSLGHLIHCSARSSTVVNPRFRLVSFNIILLYIATLLYTAIMQTIGRLLAAVSCQQRPRRRWRMG